jgi:hypothetical protein
MRKPRLKLHSAELLCEIDRYIRDYKIHGDSLKHAASDVLDGAVFRYQITELIRKKLIRIIVDCPPRRVDDECGSSWTVHLTPMSMKYFWPDRRNYLDKSSL